MKKLLIVAIALLMLSCTKEKTEKIPVDVLKKELVVTISSDSPDGFDMYYQTASGVMDELFGVDSIWTETRPAYLGMVLFYGAKPLSRASVEIRGTINDTQVFRTYAYNTFNWVIKNDTLTVAP